MILIESIQLKFGAAREQPPLSVITSAVTLFVGPNNSGKSKVLLELADACYQGGKRTNCDILGKISFCNLDEGEALEVQSQLVRKPLPQESVSAGDIVIGKGNQRFKVNEKQFLSVLQSLNANLDNASKWVLSHIILRLDGSNRTRMIESLKATDLQEEPQHFLDILFRDDVKRKEVRRIIKDAFNLYFVVDPTALGQFRIRLSPIEPPTVLHEKGIQQDSVDFHAQAPEIMYASDGVKAFTGLITAVIAGDPRIVIIDEPEAFLHPSLASLLGKEISIAASRARKNLFVSTHSSHFVLGCIQSGAPINIIRLTYRGGIPTARSLQSEKLLVLMRNPLLRSAGVLNGLFYESVVVTESDSDRAFYQEINERLLRESTGRGIPNCLFLNAQNKQTVHQVILPLRELGIPAACIVDIDVLKEGGKVWTDFLKGGVVPSASHAGLGDTRSKIRNACEQSGKNMKTDGGIDVLLSSDRNAANDLFDQLEKYGLFVVRSGELESWLKHLGVRGHGPKWLIPMFEQMGDSPDGPDYVRPCESDVWEFIDRIQVWLHNPLRRGIPIS